MRGDKGGVRKRGVGGGNKETLLQYAKPGRKTHHRTARVGGGKKRLYLVGIKRRW